MVGSNQNKQGILPSKASAAPGKDMRVTYNCDNGDKQRLLWEAKSAHLCREGGGALPPRCAPGAELRGVKVSRQREVRWGGTFSAPSIHMQCDTGKSHSDPMLQKCWQRAWSAHPPWDLQVPAPLGNSGKSRQSPLLHKGIDVSPENKTKTNKQLPLGLIVCPKGRGLAPLSCGELGREGSWNPRDGRKFILRTLRSTRPCPFPGSRFRILQMASGLIFRKLLASQRKVL